MHILIMGLLGFGVIYLIFGAIIALGKFSQTSMGKDMFRAIDDKLGNIGNNMSSASLDNNSQQNDSGLQDVKFLEKEPRPKSKKLLSVVNVYENIQTGETVRVTKDSFKDIKYATSGDYNLVDSIEYYKS